MTAFPAPLVSTEWLAGHLGDPAIVILDASWFLPVTGRDGQREYQAAHIPGARFFDLDRLSATDSPLPHMLPAEATLAAQFGALGIGPDHFVVVYDGSGTNISAGRAWWMLRTMGHARVAVLDGGLPRWKAEGRSVSSETVTWEPVSFTPRLNPDVIRSRKEVGWALQWGDAQVVDMRSAGRFSGTDPEPRAGLSSGHMPGAINLPYHTLVDGDGLALTGNALRERLQAAGVDPARPIIATCGSGVSACTLLLALDTLGVGNASLYDGSWTEWASTGGEIVKDS